MAPVICLAIFFSGMMDLFHLLLEIQLIRPSAPYEEIVNFSWTVSRFFNVLILPYRRRYLFYQKRTPKKRTTSCFSPPSLFCSASFPLLLFILCSP